MNILKILTEKRQVGDVGERAAEKHLKRCGYKILERNYVAVGHEIDIIAEDHDHTVFVEVKTRTIGAECAKEARPASSVTPQKQRKIIATAKYYLGSYTPGKRIRFDVIEVYLDKEKKVHDVVHLESAFNYNTAHNM